MKVKAIFLFLLVANTCFGQYYDESLLYARPGVFGTARTTGVGGAFGSVGADLGSININPAGLGLYRSTDFSITPVLQGSNNESDFLGSNSHIKLSKFSLGQVGMEWTHVLKNASSDNEINFQKNLMRSYTFCINYQRESLFARSQSFGGRQNVSSMIDRYADELNRTTAPVDYDNYEPELVNAYQLYLLDYDTSTGRYFSNVHAPVTQAGTTQTRGGVNKLSIAFATNINDKVYLGVGIGIPFLNYFVDGKFSETNINQDSTYFYSYDIASSLNVNGTGITGNLGFIYRPNAWMRFGASYQLPTWYTLTESYTSEMAAYFDTSSFGYGITSQQNPFRYKMRTPMKGTISASFYLKQHGFFSVDYELQGLGSTRFNFSNAQSLTESENATIKSLYGLNHTVRAGFEGAFKVLRLRAGYVFSSSPYKNNMAPVAGYTQARNNITAGIGMRLKKFYADFAYVYGLTKDVSQPYAADYVSNRYTTNTFMLTLGWKMSYEKTQPLATGAGGGDTY